MDNNSMMNQHQQERLPSDGLPQQNYMNMIDQDLQYQGAMPQHMGPTQSQPKIMNFQNFQNDQSNRRQNQNQMPNQPINAQFSKQQINLNQKESPNDSNNSSFIHQQQNYLNQNYQNQNYQNQNYQNQNYQKQNYQNQNYQNQNYQNQNMSNQMNQNKNQNFPTMPQMNQSNVSQSSGKSKDLNDVYAFFNSMMQYYDQQISQYKNIIMDKEEKTKELSSQNLKCQEHVSMMQITMKKYQSDVNTKQNEFMTQISQKNKQILDLKTQNEELRNILETNQQNENDMDEVNNLLQMNNDLRQDSNALNLQVKDLKNELHNIHCEIFTKNNIIKQQKEEILQLKGSSLQKEQYNPQIQQHQYQEEQNNQNQYNQYQEEKYNQIQESQYNPNEFMEHPKQSFNESEKEISLEDLQEQNFFQQEKYRKDQDSNSIKGLLNWNPDSHMEQQEIYDQGDQVEEGKNQKLFLDNQLMLKDQILDLQMQKEKYLLNLSKLQGDSNQNVWKDNQKKDLRGKIEKIEEELEFISTLQ